MMSELPRDFESSRRLRHSRFAAGAMSIGAFLLGLAVLAWALVSLYGEWAAIDPSSTGEVQAATRATIGVVVLLVAGWAGALLLWGLAEAVYQLDQLNTALAEEPGSAPAPAPMPAPAPTFAADSPGLTHVRELLEELRDLTLLNDEQRGARFRVQGEALARKLETEIPQLLREHNWVAARARLREAKQRFPTMTEWESLGAQIEATREKVEQKDIEMIERQVNDLAALGAWDRANEAVRDLLHRHPGSPPAEELAKRVAREREQAQSQERARLLQQAQAASDRKDWQQALKIAQSLVERFPNSLEAQTLEHQLPVLRDNAEIQTRQQMEAQIRDLAKQHRFIEAVGIARSLLDRFPNSPQAAVLREQLPRMQERAEHQRQTAAF